MASAGYSNGGGALLLTRLEVSKDNSTWVNYLAETNSGGQTLTVSPGDTVYFRLKTWDTGDTPAINITYTASYTNPSYIDALDPFHAGVNDDLDGNDPASYYALTGLPDATAGTLTFDLDGVAVSSEITGYESGGMVVRVKAGTPDQTVILATVIITGASQVGFNWWQRLFVHAYADSSATTQVRLLVSNPPAVAATPTLPVTGPDPIQLIMAPVMRLCR